MYTERKGKHCGGFCIIARGRACVFKKHTFGLWKSKIYRGGQVELRDT